MQTMLGKQWPPMEKVARLETSMRVMLSNHYIIYICLLRNGMFSIDNIKTLRRCAVYLEKILNSNDEREVISKHDQSNLSGIVPPKYKIFRDEDASIIFDVDEEREKINLENLNAPYEELDIYDGIKLTRGISGVYDIDDLVDLLHKNNLMEIFVASVPQNQVYVDYVVVVSGRSTKHMLATAETVRRIFKKKKNPRDRVPSIEGKNSKDWIALDLGNIALHIFSQQARKMYDLETLWSVGSEYDDQINEPIDRLTEYIGKHSYLANLQPAESQD
ncbi:uncharacterized protein LOC105688195 [Athalia rosae]|uniref:uncharacterized protein LOC105688195 n=1 Tax=Athalia rosae TaxID=37344 RepID=UPI002033D195|nr:uncharacterized protein LOC105688195 [Athalia rosae]